MFNPDKIGFATSQFELNSQKFIVESLNSNNSLKAALKKMGHDDIKKEFDQVDFQKILFFAFYDQDISNGVLFSLEKGPSKDGINLEVCLYGNKKKTAKKEHANIVTHILQSQLNLDYKSLNSVSFMIANP
jgi:hypothetical protein